MQKLALAITIIAIAAVISGGSAYYYFRNISPAANTGPCNYLDSISSHVYNPDRLTILKPCITASGYADDVSNETDGDYHLRLALDGQYDNLTNSANIDYQNGDLVVEIICALSPSQQDAISACQGYTNNITVPSVNDHIIVTGPYVLDTNHYDWAEIHPVYSLTIP